MTLMLIVQIYLALGILLGLAPLHDVFANKPTMTSWQKLLVVAFIVVFMTFLWLPFILATDVSTRRKQKTWSIWP